MTDPNRPLTGLLWFDVVKVDPVFGVTDLVLERIQAADCATAERTAVERHGKSILVTRTMPPRRRRRRELPKDIGNITRRNR